MGVWEGGARGIARKLQRLIQSRLHKRKFDTRFLSFFLPFFSPPLKLQNAESCWGAEHTDTLQREAAGWSKEAAAYSSVVTENTRTGRN